MKRVRLYRPGRCLFETSCSRAVFKACLEGGALVALRCLKDRVMSCNADYKISSDNGRFIGVELSTGRIAQEEELAEGLVKDIKLRLESQKAAELPDNRTLPIQ